MVITFTFYSCGQLLQEVANWPVIEAPRALLQEENEVRIWGAVMTAQMAFGSAPELLDTIDRVAFIREQLRVIDALMMELRGIQNVVRTKAIGIDNAIGLNTFSNNPKHCP